MRTSPLLAAVAALLVAGCVLHDGRETPVLLPEGELHGAADVSVTVAYAGRWVDARFLLDGREVGDRDGRVDLSGASEGPHWLVAVIDDGPRPVSTEPRRVHVDRTAPSVTFDPAPGAVAFDGPFRVTLRFGEPLPPEWRGPPVLVVDSRATLRFDASGRTAVAEFPVPLEALGRVGITFDATDLAGNRGLVHAEWTAPSAAWTFVRPDPAAGEVRAAGDLDVAVAWAGGIAPPSAELLAGELVVGTLAPPAWALRWDTRSFPEGRYALSLRPPPGWALRAEGALSVVVDRTGPGLRTWWRADEALHGAGVRECFGLGFTEPVRALRPAFSAGGVALAVRSATVWGARENATVCPEPAGVPLRLPAAFEIRIVAEDDGGASTEHVLSLEAPAWRGAVEPFPWNVFPQPGLALRGWRAGQPSDPPLAFAMLAGEGVPGDVALGVLGSSRGWPVVATLDPDPALPPVSFAAGRGGELAWTDAGEGSRTRVWAATLSPDATATPPSLVTPVAVDGLAELAAGAGAVAWTEPAGAGRAVRVVDLTAPYGAVLARSDPAAVARAPAVDGPAAAWLEDAPGGPTLLLAARRDGAGEFGAAEGPLNADPSVSAGAPSLAADTGPGAVVEALLAWEEGGRIWARLRAPGGPFGPAAPVSPAGLAARLARASLRNGPLVAFVVREGDVERVEAAVHDGAGWTADPTVTLFAGTGIRDLVIGDGAARALGWIDSGNQVRILVRNE